MRKTLLITGLLIISTTIFAEGPIGKGQTQINAGVGLSSWGFPVYAGLDYGVHQDITVGGEVSFRSYKESIASLNYSSTVIGISGNGNYHFNNLLNIPSDWDFYAGLNIGFYVWNLPSNYPGTNSSGLGIGAQVGGRYYLNNKLSLNLELGSGNAFSGGKFGITIKL